MSPYVVTYDLHQAGQNYDCLIAKLKTYPVFWHIQQSVWIIRTSESASQVRDKLSSCLDSNDKLVVARLSGDAAWTGYSMGDSSWLRSELAA